MRVHTSIVIKRSINAKQGTVCIEEINCISVPFSQTWRNFQWQIYKFIAIVNK